ncbi:hypothetical protein QNM99_03990 [Pseudomonas sp. PCH446]
MRLLPAGVQRCATTARTTRRQGSGERCRGCHAGTDTKAGTSRAAAPPPEPPEPPRAISQRQWSAEELDLDSLDLDEELARLEQREIQPTKAFGQDRAARASPQCPPRRPGHGRRAMARQPVQRTAGKHLDAAPADDGETAPAKTPEKKVEQAKSARTEPSLSFDLANLDDEPRSAPAA